VLGLVVITIGPTTTTRRTASKKSALTSAPGLRAYTRSCRSRRRNRERAASIEAVSMMRLSLIWGYPRIDDAVAYVDDQVGGDIGDRYDQNDPLHRWI